jgi:hypothetical protein
MQAMAKMMVKTDSIWFLEVGNLSTRQKLKKSGNRAGCKALSFGAQEAWQFGKPVTGQNHQL